MLPSNSEMKTNLPLPLLALAFNASAQERPPVQILPDLAPLPIPMPVPVDPREDFPAPPSPMNTIPSVTLLALAIQLPAAESAKVIGTILTPKTVKAYGELELEIRLYEFHPFIADKPADLVGKFNVKKYVHKAGAETKTQFIVGDAAIIKPRRSYYLTCFVLDAKGKRILMGEKNGKRGICNVLTEGNPRKVNLILRDLRK